MRTAGLLSCRLDEAGVSSPLAELLATMASQSIATVFLHSFLRKPPAHERLVGEIPPPNGRPRGPDYLVERRGLPENARNTSVSRRACANRPIVQPFGSAGYPPSPPISSDAAGVKVFRLPRVFLDAVPGLRADLQSRRRSPFPVRTCRYRSGRAGAIFAARYRAGIAASTRSLSLRHARDDRENMSNRRF